MIPLFGLLGKNLAHSVSPFIHGALNNPSYTLYETDDIVSFFSAFSLKGINVTLPYKQSVVPLCDVLSTSVKATGVCNTIVNQDRRLHAYNTDYDAVMSLIRYGFPKNKTVVIAIIGNGATSKTIVAALKASGYTHIHVYARNPNNQESPLTKLHTAYDSQVLINTTPVGMYPDNTGSLGLDLSIYETLELVFDVVYNPWKTALIKNAHTLNIRAINGLPMLVLQAFYSHRLFHPNQPDNLSLESLYKRTLRHMINIVLTGLPYAGKSTLAPILAKNLHKSCTDLDQLIEEASNTSISDMIVGCGEAYFRSLEEDYALVAAKKINQVIATGGGMVENATAMSALKQTGLVIHIDYAPSLMASQLFIDRPLVKNLSDLIALKNRRDPLYFAYADVIINKQTTATLPLIEEIEVSIHDYIDYQWTKLELPRYP